MPNRTRSEPRPLSSCLRMTAAIFGFLGVLVGAIITFLSSFYLERRRERQQREREEESLATELRTAARLIEEELARASGASHIVSESKKWWHPSGVVTITAWAQHRAVLAGQISDKDWKSLRLAYVAVERLIQVRAEAPPGDPNDRTVKFVAERLETPIKEALQTLTLLKFFSA